MEELKPCPFCGGKENMLSNRGNYVQCNCGAEGPFSDVDDDISAIKRWNTRAEPPKEGTLMFKHNEKIKELVENNEPIYVYGKKYVAEPPKNNNPKYNNEKEYLEGRQPQERWERLDKEKLRNFMISKARVNPLDIGMFDLWAEAICSKFGTPVLPTEDIKNLEYVIKELKIWQEVFKDRWENLLHKNDFGKLLSKEIIESLNAIHQAMRGEND